MAVDLTGIVSKPVFFERNRVSRVYTGGKLFHGFFGDQDEDGTFPEEWIASSVRALNKDSADPKEGISKVRDTDAYFDDIIIAHKDRMLDGRDNVGILVKILDSAIRLPVQAHPDRIFSKRHFGSGYGKAEAWLILATREGANIYFGFKERMTQERFLDAVERSERDKGAMEELLNVVPAKTGDVFFIPAKAVHAIGRGCLILEIQEPTDFTLQPEAWCGDYKLSNYEKYLGLNRDVALECFDYDFWGEAAVALGRKTPKIMRNERGLVSESLIGPTDTACFALNRHRLEAGSLQGLRAPAIYIVTGGAGELSGKGYAHALKKGDYFFLPACASEKYDVASETSLELVECLPPAL